MPEGDPNQTPELLGWLAARTLLNWFPLGSVCQFFGCGHFAAQGFAWHSFGDLLSDRAIFALHVRLKSSNSLRDSGIVCVQILFVLKVQHLAVGRDADDRSRFVDFLAGNWIDCASFVGITR